MQKMLLSFLVLLLTTAQAATITVGPDGCDHKSVQAAIDAATRACGALCIETEPSGVFA